VEKWDFRWRQEPARIKFTSYNAPAHIRVYSTKIRHDLSGRSPGISGPKARSRLSPTWERRARGRRASAPPFLFLFSFFVFLRVPAASPDHPTVCPRPVSLTDRHQPVKRADVTLLPLTGVGTSPKELLALPPRVAAFVRHSVIVRAQTRRRLSPVRLSPTIPGPMFCPAHKGLGVVSSQGVEGREESSTTTATTATTATTTTTAKE
jgi:hypothetical protein